MQNRPIAFRMNQIFLSDCKHGLAYAWRLEE